MPDPEALARIEIEPQLKASGWVVHDHAELYGSAVLKGNPGSFQLRAESLEGNRETVAESSPVYADLSGRVADS